MARNAFYRTHHIYGIVPIETPVMPSNTVPTPQLSEWELAHHTPEQVVASVDQIDARYIHSLGKGALNE